MPEKMPTPLFDVASLEGERWIPVPGYEGIYEVSDQGRVKSLNKRRRVPRILRPNVKHLGYQSVCLYRGDARRNRQMVHRLVLTAFVGECPEGHEACHRDGNGSNNRLFNLYWGTPVDNAQDTIRHGNNFHANKTHCKNGHEFTPENTLYRYKDRDWRYCRACIRGWQKKHSVRKSGAA